MQPAIDRARQERGLVTLSIALAAAFVFCVIVAACVGTSDAATWWLTLGSAISSLAVVIFASSRMASIIARAARHAQILDEVAREVSQGASLLLSCGEARLTSETEKAFSDAVSSASELTKSVGLLGKCSPDESVCGQIRQTALQMKRELTDSVIDTERVRHARNRNEWLRKLLLRLRMLA
jgi:hypothetical protein